MRTRPAVARLYDSSGAPVPGFNSLITDWLANRLAIREHSPPAAFDGIRNAYDTAVKVRISAGLSLAAAHRTALSDATTLMLRHNLASELGKRLSADLVNPTGGFRTTLSQGVAKNVGENFVNLIVYALATVLRNDERVLVDKGMPQRLKTALALTRNVPLKTEDIRIRLPIEGDAAIFARDDPLNAIILSAKTRLKEVFHIGTMWKLLFDVIGDDYCLRKWGLERETTDDLTQILYVFATADMVATGGQTTQGPDVERPRPRNLIAMDASFFDYVFVSKTGITHVENTLLLGHRGALFHELGCLLDLVQQKFGLRLDGQL